jgi:pyrimidine operon attenuation protein/uracil phosphoribosyltransferase
LTCRGKIRYALNVDSRQPSDADPGEALVERRVVADAHAVSRMLRRIAHEIVERNHGTSGLALVGIRTGGFYLAERLKGLIEGIEQGPVPVGAVDITLYRDDVFMGLPRPEVGTTELPFRLAGATIVLVDDVLYTGRTVRAALDVLLDYGRPKQVQLAALVDRGHRELPIRADYIGVTVETGADDSIKVWLEETGEDDRIILRSRVTP